MAIIKLKSIVEGIIKEYEGDLDRSKQRSVQISMDKAWNELRTRFSEACAIYAKHPTFGIYRAYNSSRHSDRQSDLFYLIDPKVSIRSAKEANNFYTHWISYSPRWKGYPPRNKSVIGALDKYVAADYGSMIYVLVPENGARIAVANTRDAWMSFAYASSFTSTPNFNVGVDSLSHDISNFFTAVARIVPNMDLSIDRDKVDDLMDQDPEKFLKIIEKHKPQIIDAIPDVKDKIKSTPESWVSSRKERMIRFADRILQYQDKSFEEMFDEMYDPKQNNIDLVNGIQELYTKYIDADHEVWTDADCLLIPMKYRDVNDNDSNQNRYLDVFKRVMRGDNPPNDQTI